MRRLAQIATAAALLFGIATPAAAADAEARIGRATTVGGLTVVPLSVVEDSRCPMNARCVWAGRITVRVLVRQRGRSVTRNLTLGTPIQHARGRLALVSAEPGRMAGTPRTRPRAYRFAFSYER